MGNAKTFLFTVFATSVHAITTQIKHEDFRRHIGQPPTDWERGLREATHQALLREHNTDPSLRDRLLVAPIVGRQDTFVPFGDITVLARGQLYSGPYGYKYVQDRYQNDCDECHNRRIRCGPFQCEGFKLQGDQDELIALWTVKRIRHRDPRYGHRYEMEYTISPIHAGMTTFITSTGSFDYNLPGHVFIEKNDTPKFVPHQLISPPIDHGGDVPRWHNTKTNSHYKPGILLGVDPNGYKHILHDIPDLHKINKEFAPYVHQQQHVRPNKNEYDLYKGLIESLDAKTSSLKPNTDRLHKFSYVTTPELYGFDKTPNTEISLQVVPLTRPNSLRKTTPTTNGDYFSFFSPTLPMIAPQKTTMATPTSTSTTGRFQLNPIFISRTNRPTSPTYTKEPIPLQTPITTITYFMPVDEIPQDIPKTPQTTIFTAKAPETTLISATTQPKQITSNNYIPNGYGFDKSSSKSSTKSTSTPFISKQEKTTRSKGVYLSNKNYSSGKTTLLSPTPSATTNTVFISNRNGINSTLTSPMMTTPMVTTTTIITSTNTKSSTKTLFLSNAANTTLNTNSITTNTVPLPSTTAMTTETTLIAEPNNTNVGDAEILITPRSNINVFTSTTATTDRDETTTESSVAVEKATTVLKENLIKSTTKLPSKSLVQTTKKILTSTRNDDDDLDIFGSNDKKVYTNKPQSSTTRRVENFKNEGDFLFGSLESNNKPKVIYSNFYKASTSAAPNKVTDNTNAATEEPSPRTSLSYLTSISYEVNRANTTKATQTIQFDPTIKARVRELPNDGKLKIYKAELPDVDSTRKTATKRESNEDLDLLALSLVNHARTIKILNSTTKMPKYKRKSFSTRIKYTRKRKL